MRDQKNRKKSRKLQTAFRKVTKIGKPLTILRKQEDSKIKSEMTEE